jgi:hypothetical protein
MATIQRGARGTIDLLDDLIVQEMMQKVAVLETNARPLTTVMMQLEKAVATDTPEPQHSEDELLPNIDVTTATSTAADTTIDVSNPGYYLAGDIIHVPRTGENMRVTTAAGTSPITVVRGLGSVPPANLVVGEPLWILGGASREGDTSRQALNTLEVPYTEYCQILRNSIEGTGTQLATRQLGGDFEDQAEKKLIEHKRQMENMFKYGIRSRTQDTNEWVRTMGGLLHRIQINRFDVDGVLGEGEWEAFLEQGFQYGNARKLFIGSPRAMRSINNFARNRLVTVPGDENYGIALRRYESHSGVVDMVNDRELKGATYGGYGILLDVDYLVIRYLRAGSTTQRPQKYQGNMFCKRIENIQANDADTRKDEWFSELCLQMIHERVHAVMTGVQG